MTRAFGFDIAGYAGGNSGFAHADLVDDVIQVTVYEGHVFARKLRGQDPQVTVADDEIQVLNTCREVGALIVDTPVKLQGLPNPANVYFTWELVKRPVDYAFDALSPLANLIGAPVARFQNLLSALREEAGSEEVNEVLETYPAATLKLLGLWQSGYGSQPMRFTNGRWEGGSLADIANNLGMVGEEGDDFNGDEFDAALCAITGVVAEDKLLRGHELADSVRRRIQARVPTQHHFRISACVPQNYVLMQSPPETEIRLVKWSVNGLVDMLRVVRG